MGAQGYENGLKAYQRGDFATARREFQLLADQGDPDAQYNLAVMFAHGQGGPQDYEEMHNLIRKAAKGGNSEAQYNLGARYRQGHRVPQNDKEAFEWFHLAAEQGHIDAQTNLGAMYGNGDGVQQDLVRAHMWSILAADKGNPTAIGNRNTDIRKMTPAQIGEARALARECLARKFKGCD